MSEIAKLLAQALGKRAVEAVLAHIDKGRQLDEITVRQLVDKALTESEQNRLRRALAVERARRAAAGR